MVLVSYGDCYAIATRSEGEGARARQKRFYSCTRPCACMYMALHGYMSMCTRALHYTYSHLRLICPS